MKATLSKIKKWYAGIPDVKYNIAEKVIWGIVILLICADVFYACALSLDIPSIDNHSELVLLGLAFTLFLMVIVLATQLSAVYRALHKSLKYKDNLTMCSSKEANK